MYVVTYQRRNKPDPHVPSACTIAQTKAQQHQKQQTEPTPPVFLSPASIISPAGHHSGVELLQAREEGGDVLAVLKLPVCWGGGAKEMKRDVYIDYIDMYQTPCE